jgi:hypothetical protein
MKPRGLKMSDSKSQPTMSPRPECTKRSKRFLLASILMLLTSFSAFSSAGSFQTNLINNPEFSSSLHNWISSGITIGQFEGSEGSMSQMASTEYTSFTRSGALEQDIDLSTVDIDGVNIGERLSKGELQVVFGGWHAAESDNYNTAKISITFLDSKDEPISAPAVISAATSTGLLDWVKREASSIIPPDTKKIRYRVDLKKNNKSGYIVLFDNAFLYLGEAEDKDRDGVLDIYDIDNDNDGLVDPDSESKNILSNSNFSKLQTDWTFSGAVIGNFESNSQTTSLMFSTNYISHGREGFFEQTITLNQLGFNPEKLRQHLAQNKLKVVYGGWHASAHNLFNNSKITVTFHDLNGEEIDQPSLISKGGTFGLDKWIKREEAALIPASTDSIKYRVDLNKDNESGHQIRFDDAYLFIARAHDDDLDNIMNELDIDNDSDGIVDIEYESRNLLKNSDFSAHQTGWDLYSLTFIKEEGIHQTDSTILSTESFFWTDSGYAQQDIALSTLGFRTQDITENASTERLGAVFGGWHATQAGMQNTATIKLIFIGADEKETAPPEIISAASSSQISSWKYRERSVLIPKDTTILRYRVELSKERIDGHNVRFDDPFLNIRSFSDVDLDNISDVSDLDSNQDGIIDPRNEQLNLLKNPEFLEYQTSWSISGLDMQLLQNQHGQTSLMVTNQYSSYSKSGYLEQDINLDRLGIDGDKLDGMIRSQVLFVNFGGTYSTVSEQGNTTEIQLQFLDSEENSVGEPVTISPQSTSGAEDWKKLEAVSQVPVGTRTLRFRTLLEKRGSGHLVKFDAPFVYLTYENNTQPSNQAGKTESSSNATKSSSGGGILDLTILISMIMLALFRTFLTHKKVDLY